MLYQLPSSTPAIHEGKIAVSIVKQLTWLFLAGISWIVISSPVFAQAVGGAGGDAATNGLGGAGGTGATPNGVAGSAVGGGGGGAGVSAATGLGGLGGAGGAGNPNVSAGAAGGSGGAYGLVNPGAITSTNGTNGSAAASAAAGFVFGGGGGGGGAGGGGAVSFGGVIAITGTVTGGTGGAGGAGGFANLNTGGNGGAGGGGGNGVDFTGSATVVNNATVTGGTGGIGGNGGDGPANFGGGGGAGGVGGSGINFNNSSTITNNGSLVGGVGAAAGAAGAGSGPTRSVPSGSGGAGGSGITGANLTIINNGTISGGLGSGGARANSITFTGGNNFITFANATSGLTGNVAVTGTLTFDQVISTTLSNVVTGSGSISKANSGILTMAGTNTYSGGTSVNTGTLALQGAGTLGSTAANTSVNGGILDLGGTTQTQANAFHSGGLIQNGLLALTNYQIAGGTLASSATINASGAFDVRSGVVNGVLTGAGALTKSTSSVVALAGTNTYSGGTTVSAGTLAVQGAGTLGSTAANTSVNGGVLDLGGTAQTQANAFHSGGVIQNGLLAVTNYQIAGGTLAASTTINASATFDVRSGSVDGVLTGTGVLTKSTSSSITLTGANTYTGATFVNAGTLNVAGALTGTSGVTVQSGALLTGAGSITSPSVTVKGGGSFAPGDGTPGSFTSITGSLALQSGAAYMVQLNPLTSSLTQVTGAASVGGAAVNAAFANGLYISKQYTILTANGGVSGTFSPGVIVSNLPSGFKTTLSYDANNAYLNLALVFTPAPTPGYTPPAGLNINQQAVADALSGYFNGNGKIPVVYGTLTPADLTQASGELGTSAQQTTFRAMDLFLGLLTDPFMSRASGDNTVAPLLGYNEIAQAYAAFPANKVATISGPAERKGWSLWGAAYGGSQSTDGNSVLGSNRTTSSVYGVAAGADYLLTPSTLAGFALAGGGTNFGVTNLGSGRSDLFQAGAYLRHVFGASYISAALAYGWQDITTDRTVTSAGTERLRAEFNANTWSGRFEGGHRFVTPGMNGFAVTPYGAAQFTTFQLPAYVENVLTGPGNFALAYNAKSATDTRSELGLRGDKAMALSSGVLTLRGRAAWAHDFDPDRSAAATFLTLPGASFVVRGAAQAHDSALTTASLDMNWMNGWSAAASFEGEFSNVTKSYAGKGILRYRW